MAAKDDIREFLKTRRAKITPEQAGLPVYGANRRVTGLRREEVALLAGFSVEYYTRLERGSVGSVSEVGRKRFHHPVVGDLELDFEAFELPGDPGQRINIYAAPPDSPSAEALSLLASWSAREPAMNTTTTPTENEDTWNS